MNDDLETQVRQLLTDVGLKHVAEPFAAHLPDDPAERVRVLRTLSAILAEELVRQIEGRIKRRIKESKLPELPTLEGFDFDFQTGVDRALILDLATLGWVDRTEDLLFVGDSGTGKSHLAKALCLVACGQQRRVLYTTCADMLCKLHAALADGTLADKLKPYIRASILCIDDLGYDPIEQEQAREAQLLYKVLEARHGKHSTIITSNLVEAEEWSTYLGDHYLTVALLDRLLYRGTVVRIQGPSWRMAQHHKRNAERAGTSTSDDDTPPSDDAS